jgi:hypothetical protein
MLLINIIVVGRASSLSRAASDSRVLVDTFPFWSSIQSLASRVSKEGIPESRVSVSIRVELPVVRVADGSVD